MKYNSSTEYKSCFHIFQSIRLFWNVGVLPGGNHCHSQKDCCVGSYNDGDKLRISAISYLVIADTKLCVFDLKLKTHRKVPNSKGTEESSKGSN